MFGTKSAGLAVALLALSACSEKTENQVGQHVDNAENAVENAADTAGNALGNVGQALMPTPSGQEFVDRAAKSDAFEIAAAGLAATNGESAAVKDFAKMMISAHTESTAAIKKAAAEAAPAITPNATLTKDQEEDLSELRGLKGAAFDKEYIDGQVDAHEDALALMRKYAADGTVSPLKAAAAKIAPVVEQHLASVKLMDKD